MRDLLAPLSRRDLTLLAALAAVFVGLALFTESHLPQRGPSPWPALSVHSNEPDGSRALFLWLQEMGYRANAIEFRPFQVNPSAKLLFLLAPSSDLSPAHVAELQGWVERGGTLVVAADRPNPLLERLGVQVEPRGDRPSPDPPSLLDRLGPKAKIAEAPPSVAAVRQPVFENPPVRRVEAGGYAALTFSRPDWVTLLGQTDGGDAAAAAVAIVGRGRVFVLASGDPLSNGYLARADNWALVLHFLRAVPAGSLLLFDEYHHGFTESGTLNARLLGEPWGWALLFGGALLFAYVALALMREVDTLRSRLLA